MVRVWALNAITRSTMLYVIDIGRCRPNSESRCSIPPVRLAANRTSRSLSPSGDLVGYYIDGSGVLHGFLRDAKGTITTIDAPGAGICNGCGTQGHVINPSGTVVGYLIGVGGTYHGFVRDPNGAITTFDIPGAGTGRGTITTVIDAAGNVSGYTIDSSNVRHAYLHLK